VDSVAVPYPVEVVKTKTNYSGWFAFFALLIVGAGGWIVWRKIEK
jgi:LPXTG-motif cell wall-anchored protein